MEITSEVEINEQHTPTKKRKIGKSEKEKVHLQVPYNQCFEKEFPFLKPHSSNAYKAVCKTYPATLNGNVSSFRCER